MIYFAYFFWMLRNSHPSSGGEGPCLAEISLLEGEEQNKHSPLLTYILFFLSSCISWKKEDDVRIEAFEDDSEAEGSGGEMDIKELRAKKQALARKVAEQQRRQDKIQVGWAV